MFPDNGMDKGKIETGLKTSKGMIDPGSPQSRISLEKSFWHRAGLETEETRA